MKDTILEVEESIQNGIEALRSLPLNQKLSAIVQYLAPDGYHPIVELQEDGRKKRRTASVDNWDPETGEILISFAKDERTNAKTRAPEQKPSPTIASTRPSAAPISVATNQHGLPANVSTRAVEELCSALEEAEREGRAFIALKWFRDKFLPAKGFRWALDEDERQAVLGGAVESGAIVTSKIANPRSPFPTTTIRLNRSRASGPKEQRFNPIRIHGEPLSATILRERGER